MLSHLRQQIFNVLHLVSSIFTSFLLYFRLPNLAFIFYLRVRSKYVAHLPGPTKYRYTGVYMIDEPGAERPCLRPPWPHEGVQYTPLPARTSTISLLHLTNDQQSGICHQLNHVVGALQAIGKR